MFENEHTVHSFMAEKAEGQFHDNYEGALEQVRSQFGRKYAMVIGGRDVRTPTTIAHMSPIDTRIVLGHLPVAGAGHVKQAVAAAKKAFASWSRTDYHERVRICSSAAD